MFKLDTVAAEAARGVFLKDHDYMADPASDSSFTDHANARHVQARLRGMAQPPVGSQLYTPLQLAIFEAWIVDGFSP